MENAPVSIMGVDNGTSALGLSFCYFDLADRVLSVEGLHTLLAGPQAYRLYPRLLQRRGRNAARRAYMQTEFKEWLLNFEPEIVAIETPFIGSSDTLNNFAPLTLSLEGLIDTVEQVEDILDRRIYVERVSPHEAKKAVTAPGAKFDSSKDVVKPNILKHTAIDTTGLDLELHTLDAIDAIAIAYAGACRIAPY